MFLFSLFVGLNPAQNTKGIDMHISNEPVKAFWLTRKTKQCAGSRFAQHKTKQLCTLLLKFVELPNQFALSTMVKGNTKQDSRQET